VAVAEDEAGKLIAFDTASGEELQSIELPGEVPQDGIQVVGDRLAFAVVDELGTVGTGLYTVDLNTATASLTRVGSVDRAVTAGTDGHSVWMRGQDFAARWPDVTSSRLDTFSGIGGFGWIDGDGDFAWMTDRDLRAVRKYEGSSLVAEVKLSSSPGPLLVTADAVYVASESMLLRMDRDTLLTQGTVSLSGPAVSLQEFNDGVLVITNDSIELYPSRGAPRVLEVDRLAAPAVVAIDEASHAVLICGPSEKCVWIELE
jgi:hypothetical protein